MLQSKMDSYNNKSATMFLPGNIGKLADKGIHAALFGAKRTSTFTAKIIATGGVKREDTSLDAATKAIKRTEGKKKKRFDHMNDLIKEFDVECNEVIRLRDELRARQYDMAEIALHGFSATVIQIAARAHRGKMRLKALNAERILSQWIYFRKYFKRRVYCASIIQRAFRLYKYICRLQLYWRRDSAARVIQKKLRHIRSKRLLVACLCMLQVVKRTRDHCMVFAMTRATRKIIERDNAELAMAMNTPTSRYVANFRRKKRNAILRGKEGKLTFFILGNIHTEMEPKIKDFKSIMSQTRQTVSEKAKGSNFVLQWIKTKVEEKQAREMARKGRGKLNSRLVNRRNNHLNRIGNLSPGSPAASVSTSSSSSVAAAAAAKDKQAVESMYTVDDLPYVMRDAYRVKSLPELVLLIMDLSKIAHETPSMLDGLPPRTPGTAGSTASTASRSSNNTRQHKGGTQQRGLGLGATSPPMDGGSAGHHRMSLINKRGAVSGGNVSSVGVSGDSSEKRRKSSAGLNIYDPKAHHGSGVGFPHDNSSAITGRRRSVSIDKQEHSPSMSRNDSTASTAGNRDTPPPPAAATIVSNNERKDNPTSATKAEVPLLLRDLQPITELGTHSSSNSSKAVAAAATLTPTTNSQSMLAIAVGGDGFSGGGGGGGAEEELGSLISDQSVSTDNNNSPSQHVQAAIGGGKTKTARAVSMFMNREGEHTSSTRSINNYNNNNNNNNNNTTATPGDGNNTNINNSSSSSSSSKRSTHISGKTSSMRLHNGKKVKPKGVSIAKSPTDDRNMSLAFAEAEEKEKERERREKQRAREERERKEEAIQAKKALLKSQYISFLLQQLEYVNDVLDVHLKHRMMDTRERKSDEECLSSPLLIQQMHYSNDMLNSELHESMASRPVTSAAIAAATAAEEKEEEEEKKRIEKDKSNENEKNKDRTIPSLFALSNRAYASQGSPDKDDDTVYHVAPANAATAAKTTASSCVAAKTAVPTGASDNDSDSDSDASSVFGDMNISDNEMRALLKEDYIEINTSTATIFEGRGTARRKGAAGVMFNDYEFGSLFAGSLLDGPSEREKAKKREADATKAAAVKVAADALETALTAARKKAEGEENVNRKRASTMDDLLLEMDLILGMPDTEIGDNSTSVHISSNSGEPTVMRKGSTVEEVISSPAPGPAPASALTSPTKWKELLEEVAMFDANAQQDVLSSITAPALAAAMEATSHHLKRTSLTPEIASASASAVKSNNTNTVASAVKEDEDTKGLKSSTGTVSTSYEGDIHKRPVAAGAGGTLAAFAAQREAHQSHRPLSAQQEEDYHHHHPADGGGGSSIIPHHSVPTAHMGGSRSHIAAANAERERRSFTSSLSEGHNATSIAGLSKSTLHTHTATVHGTTAHGSTNSSALMSLHSHQYHVDNSHASATAATTATIATGVSGPHVHAPRLETHSDPDPHSPLHLHTRTHLHTTGAVAIPLSHTTHTHLVEPTHSTEVLVGTSSAARDQRSLSLHVHNGDPVLHSHILAATETEGIGSSTNSRVSSASSGLKASSSRRQAARLAEGASFPTTTTTTTTTTTATTTRAAAASPSIVPAAVPVVEEKEKSVTPARRQATRLSEGVKYHTSAGGAPAATATETATASVPSDSAKVSFAHAGTISTTSAPAAVPAPSPSPPRLTSSRPPSTAAISRLNTPSIGAPPPGPTAAPPLSTDAILAMSGAVSASVPRCSSYSPDTSPPRLAANSIDNAEANDDDDDDVDDYLNSKKSSTVIRRPEPPDERPTSGTRGASFLSNARRHSRHIASGLK